MKRRDFLHKTTVATFGICSIAKSEKAINQAGPDLVVIKNGTPQQLVTKAIETLGGIERFVKPGQIVLVKPNMAWDRLPQQAANTNPLIVAKVVELCKQAGAKRVRVLDRTCNNPKRCYKSSGIEQAAKQAGAEVRHIVDSRFKDSKIPHGEILKSWPFYIDALEADVFINIPIAKDHSISGVTLGFKNIMGIIGGERGEIHKNFATKIVDLYTVIRPTLTIIDAYRILVRNGPSGGNLSDVKEKKMLIAGIDPVAVDSYAVDLFDIERERVEYLQIAFERGLGEIDPFKTKLQEIEL